MKIQTLSVVVGDTDCNAHCPFCVSRTTPSFPLGKVNWRNFEKACRLAQISNATTVLLTGKGEPTLHPELITDYLKELMEFSFPFIELQTNAINIARDNFCKKDDLYSSYLQRWYSHGLNTICISAVHYDEKFNRKIYSKQYPDLKKLVAKLHEIGFTVRLSIMMLKGYIDSWDGLKGAIEFCKENKIKQLTARPIHAPYNSNNVTRWILDNQPDSDKLVEINKTMERQGNRVLTLSHGGVVYDYEGQNVCLANCLTTNTSIDDIRSIIFFPDGTISYDWKYKGAVLL